MDNEQVQVLLNKLLQLNSSEKNNFYHTILTIIRKNATDPNRIACDIIMEFDGFLENKRVQLDGTLNGDPGAGKQVTPGKSGAIFRRVQ